MCSANAAEPWPTLCLDKAVLGHRTTMVVTLQNHSGIPTVLQVSRGGAATHSAVSGHGGGGGDANSEEWVCTSGKA